MLDRSLLPFFPKLMISLFYFLHNSNSPLDGRWHLWIWVEIYLEVLAEGELWTGRGDVARIGGAGQKRQGKVFWRKFVFNLTWFRRSQFSLDTPTQDSYLHTMHLLTMVTSYYQASVHTMTLKVLGKSVGLCKTTKRKDQLHISLLVSIWRIICENFNANGLILAEIWMKI